MIMKKIVSMMVALMMIFCQSISIKAEGLPAVEKITWQSYQYRNDAQQVRFSWTSVPGADGYEVYFYNDIDHFSMPIERLNYTTYVWSTQDGSYRNFGVRAYKKVNGKTIYGPWKYFFFTDEDLDRLTNKRLCYKAPKGYRSVRIVSVNSQKVSFKKSFVIDEYDTCYAGSGKTKTYRFAKNCQYFTCDEQMHKQTGYWKLIKVNQASFLKSFKKHAYFYPQYFKPYIKTIKGKKYKVILGGEIAYVKIKNNKIAVIKLLENC
ncbi:hypothetical protein SG0102_14720 [Intestinibaculum porci]|uniref:Uncharacterized protein n=2 Tax=Intestinibaculum porci TaxID=2487118 RepID=A0A3G9JQJ5_9FIRM|nr:hypothetical protein SG0102_14720 [Intestinibaculum porci]